MNIEHKLVIDNDKQQVKFHLVNQVNKLFYDENLLLMITNYKYSSEYLSYFCLKKISSLIQLGTKSDQRMNRAKR